MAGYEALSEMCNSERSSSSVIILKRPPRPMSYIRRKALKKESLLQKDAKKISPAKTEHSLCFKVHSWDVDL